MKLSQVFFSFKSPNEYLIRTVYIPSFGYETNPKNSFSSNTAWELKANKYNNNHLSSMRNPDTGQENSKNKKSPKPLILNTF